MAFIDVDRRAWRALAAAQIGWMLDAMDFLLFTYAIVQIRHEFGADAMFFGLGAILIWFLPETRGTEL